MGRASNKRQSQTQSQIPTQRSKKSARDEASSEDEQSDEEPSTQYVREKANNMKDCLAFILAANSNLHPIKKNEIFSKFGDKVGRKERNAVIAALKKHLLEVGACLVAVDVNNFILVNKFSRKFITDEANPPAKQLVCLILSFIAVNRGTLSKNELEDCLSSLGICLQTSHPYFGDVGKLITSFERQCYLKKCFDKNKNMCYEWGVRAKCEVDREAIQKCIESVMNPRGARRSSVNVTPVNIPDIITPEDDMISDESDND